MELVSDGALGEIFALDLTFHNAYGPDKPWFYDRAAAGGGCLLDLGVHLLDLAQFITASPLDCDDATLRSNGLPTTREQVEDFAWAHLRTDAGAASDPPVTGRPMERDHRRILATGIARLRAKIQYRPVIFELVPESFTLGRLQATVEAVAGQHLHKQNFRRLVEQQELVEETGEVDPSTGGRPAKLYRFRRAVLDEREAAGTKLPITRSR